MLKSYPNMPNLIVKDNRGSKNRTFIPNWYKKYEWLTGTESTSAPISLAVMTVSDN